MRRIFVYIAALIWLSAWLCVEVGAQAASTGTITGTLTDPIGTVVSGAKITAVEESGGKAHGTTTDANGVYKLSELSAGSYRVTVENEKVSPADRYRPWLYRTEVDVRPNRLTWLDMSLHSAQEGLISCSCSMADDEFEKLLRDASSPDPEFALHVSTDSGSVASGSEVWLTVVLTNIASHPILVPAEKGVMPAFAYDLGVWDPCNCPIGGAQIGQQQGGDTKTEHGTGQSGDADSGPVLRLPTGGTLTDRIEVSKLLNLSGPRTYVFRVQRPDTAGGAARGHNDKQLFVRSNRISVTVMAPQNQAPKRP